MNDNGHLNQRTQAYIPIGKNSKAQYQSMASVVNTSTTGSAAHVGPGTYETARSVFRSDHKVSGPIMTGPQSLSPRARAAQTNPALNRMSVPSIPSRFLTPVIDGSQTQATTIDE